MMNKILAAFLLLNILACSEISYKNPQPAKTKNLSTFPKNFLGTYVMMDFDTIIVEEDRYIFPVEYDKAYSKIEVDISPKLEIKDGLLYDESIPFNEGIKYSERNDSVFYKKLIYGYKSLNDSLILRKFKNYYVLSELEKGEKYWKIFLLKMEEDSLKVYLNGNLSNVSDSMMLIGTESEKTLDDFKKITNFEAIGDNSYLLDPTKAEFGKLVKNNFFSVPMNLRPINE